jgi:serine/threonine protein kinase
MGEVYRARDTRLDRAVAVKILSPGIASSPDARQRFEREALAERLKTGPLATDRTLRFGVQIADALDKAAGRHPPRSETGERHGDEGRRQAARFRPRQSRAARGRV